ncbi:DHH family phosphoesterase [Alistipes sp. ZOR0009]|uniref:DHH family phosphoesterase n=1 Tax=Alistipes sp. ZOR0009 TaxID=1339253 RepID=UPI00064646E5|nr:bifunctional oligoribonuclease/PAP phosphatase NrnA [Alistipes sp. ZOR0009]
MIDNSKLEALKKLIEGATCITILTHPNPDGDAVGSSVGLRLLLKALGKEVYSVVPNSFPEFLGWMEEANQCLNYEQNPPLVEEVLSKTDLIFCVDFNSISRLNGLGELVKQFGIPKVLIDHHLFPEDDFVLQFSDLTVSSTSELVYHIAKELGLRSHLSVGAAEALYTGIMTDTGSFSYASSNPTTFHVVADLLELEINKDKIHQTVYNTFSEERMRLMGYCLSEKMVVFKSYKTAYIALTLKDLNKFKYKSGDTEGIVNLPLSIHDVNVSVLFTEQSDGSVKMSLRSKGEFSVNDFSRKYFYGGGHKNAAGGRMSMKMPELLKYFEICVRDNADEICKSI